MREAWFAALPAEDQHHAPRLLEMLAEEADLSTDERLSTLPKLGADWNGRPRSSTAAL